MQKRKVYLVVTHMKKPMKDEHGRNVLGKTEVFEQVHINNNLKTDILSTASIIIDIEGRRLVKSRSAYENVGEDAVISHYINAYFKDIQYFYKRHLNMDVTMDTPDGTADI